MSVVRTVGGTLVAGVLVGFVLAAFGSSLLGGDLLAGRPAEPSVARTYMTALLEGDGTRLETVRPPRAIAARAASVISGVDLRRLRWKPLALSYLGGGERDGVAVHLYVVRIGPPDGSSPILVPFALTVLDGKVVRVQ